MSRKGSIAPLGASRRQGGGRADFRSGGFGYRAGGAGKPSRRVYLGRDPERHETSGVRGSISADRPQDGSSDRDEG